MSALTEFLFPAPAPRSIGGIAAWWEKRRLAYNAAVGGAGLVSLVAVTLVASAVEGTLVVPPWQAVAVFGVMANVCYLLGPLVEGAAHLLWGRSVLPIGPALYRAGLTFSVGLAFLPTLLVLMLAVARVVFSGF
jgi:hypothetical protein